jgi:hypothetical protein
MPAHHELEHFLESISLQPASAMKATPPSSASGKTGTLTNSPMNGIDAYRMIRRRTAEACFRVTLDEVEQIKI